MSPERKAKIDELIVLDADYRKEQKEKYPRGVTFPSAEGDAMVHNILYGEKSGILKALEELPKDDIIFVLALAWWGRADGVAERGTTFESVLEAAESHYNDATVVYVFGLPLSRYLPAALMRGGISG